MENKSKAVKILISGFEPFGTDQINSSWKTVETLHATDRIQLKKVLLPVEFQNSWQMLKTAMEDWQPDVVLCLGQAEGRSEITIEKIGINWMDARIADNAGFWPKGQKIEEHGPDGLFSTLPINETIKTIHEHGIPSRISYSAGTYVCNNLLYELMNYIQQENMTIRGGFIHLPLLPEQALLRSAPTPSMSLQDLSTALQACLEIFA